MLNSDLVKSPKQGCIGLCSSLNETNLLPLGLINPGPGYAMARCPLQGATTVYCTGSQNVVPGPAVVVALVRNVQS